jgi:DNA-binding beta-propeller fold protein YncE
LVEWFALKLTLTMRPTLLMETSLILSGILAFAATSSLAATPPSYDFTIGPSAVPGLKNPQAVAVAPSGDVYVADTGNQRIVKFSPAGSFLSAWGGAGDGASQFASPSSIAIDSAGHVYVLDSGTELIQKFSGEGAFLTQWHCPHPTAVAVDREDSVYVADRGAESLTINHWGGGWVVEYVPGVRKFSGDGTLLRQWPLNTTPFQQYSGFGYSGTYYTGGLTVAGNGDIFVAYFYNYTDPFQGGLANWTGTGIEWFASDGTYVLDLGDTLTRESLAVDRAGNLYATDRLYRQLEMFAFGTDGSVATWGIPGSDASPLFEPRGVAVDPSGNYVYVVDSWSNRILVFAHQPTLNIRSAGANSLILSWSAEAAGYSLQQKPALGAADWADVNNPVQVVGGVNQVMIAPATGNHFYRLVHP